MLNPHVAVMTHIISTQIPNLITDLQGNVMTVEDKEGRQYMVTVESMFMPTNVNTSDDDADPIPT